MKNLVYFTVGGAPDYSKLLFLCLDSLIRTSNTSDRSSEGFRFDILIILDRSYFSILEKRLAEVAAGFRYGELKLWFLPESNNPMEISARKLAIYRYPHISCYRKIIYLDSDIVVNKDIADIFYELDNDRLLYTCSEYRYEDPHTLKYYSVRPYTDAELNFLQLHKIPVFNCGQFGFMQGEVLGHLKKIEEDMQTFSGNYFYEQSFMNQYFSLLMMTNDGVFTPRTCLEPFNKKFSDILTFDIIHFANASVPYQLKYEGMLQLTNAIEGLNAR